jgi:2-methylcitrate dehydratase PrpD
VNPFELDIANYRDPRSTLEPRFSINFCIALGMSGYGAGLEDFSEIRIEDKRVRALLGSLDMIGDESINRWPARLDVEL